MTKKSLALSLALCGALIGFILPAHAEQKACSDGEPHCISHQFQTSVVDQALLSAAIATPEQGGSPIQDGGQVPKSAIKPVDTDGDGITDDAFDLDGDGNLNVDFDTGDTNDLDPTIPADLDYDGNIDIGTGGDGTVFLDRNTNGIIEAAVDDVVMIDPATGEIKGTFVYTPDNPDPDYPQPRIAGNALGAQPSGSLTASEDKNSDHDVAASSPDQSGGDAVAADEASNAFSGPRPRCPEDNHGGGNSGGDGEGGGRPGRQSDGGGGRP